MEEDDDDLYDPADSLPTNVNQRENGGRRVTEPDDVYEEDEVEEEEDDDVS
jgi:pre-mRNA 3'-end-processing factor FIP1